MTLKSFFRKSKVSKDEEKKTFRPKKDARLTDTLSQKDSIFLFSLKVIYVHKNTYRLKGKSFWLFMVQKIAISPLSHSTYSKNVLVKSDGFF